MKANSLLNSLAILFLWCAVFSEGNNGVTEDQLNQEDDDFDESVGLFADTKQKATISEPKTDSSFSFPEEMRFQEQTAKCAYWSKKPTTGEAPIGRSNAAAFLVGKGARLVVSGGQTTDGGVDDISSLDMKTGKWSTLSPGGDTGGVKRTGAASTFQADASGDGSANLVIFGGMNSANKLQKDVMTLSVSGASTPVANWAMVETTGSIPSARQGATLTSLPDLRMVLIGGVSDSKAYNDVWFLKRVATSAAFAWSAGAVSSATDPTLPPRSRHSAAVWSGSNGDRVVVFGGVSMDGTVLHDVGVLNPSTPAGGISWSIPTVSGSLPAGVSGKRRDHTAVVIKDIMYIFGGCDKAACSGSVISLDLAAMAWKSVKFGAGGSAAAPAGLGGVAVALSSNTLYLALGCGAADGSDCAGKGDVLVLDTATACDANCLNGGYMADGLCVCADGYSGKFCDTKATVPQATTTNTGCPGECSGHGVCGADKACTCSSGWADSDCSTKAAVPCVDDCSGHGTCVEGVCQCSDGFFGKACRSRSCPGSPACSSKGKCHHDSGLCECWPGFGGEDCSGSGLCPNNCTSATNGVCTPLRSPNGTSYSCVCAEGWSGANCEEDLRCPQNLPAATACNGHGKCSNFKCKCDDSHSGLRCEFLKCPGSGPAGQQCSGHGTCNNATGVCSCDPEFQGKACADKPKCVKTCAPNGVCARDDAGTAPSGFDGVCSCNPGFAGDDCNSKGCPLALNLLTGEQQPCGGENSGVCNNATGKCECVVGLAGRDCSLKCPEGKVVLPRNGESSDHISTAPCSGRGQCVTGINGGAVCACMSGRSGLSCNQTSKCPGGCSGHGRCHSAKCFCDLGFEGPACKVPTPCPRAMPPKKNAAAGSESESQSEGESGGEVTADTLALQGIVCAGHGVCSTGSCFCAPGWGGSACDTKKPCPADCSGHGTCSLGRCFCAPGFAGKDCATQLPCVKNCSGHGICHFSKCVCERGYIGKGCSEFDDDLLGFPHGTAGAAGNASSSSNVTAPRFAETRMQMGSMVAVTIAASGAEGCLNNCGAPQRGKCVLGRCMCMPGFNGDDCSTEEPGNCATACAEHGVCKYNKCFCNPGWQGDNCDKPVSCPKDCNGHGECKFGQCFCSAGYRGVACGFEEQCPNSCNDRGLCLRGQCLCNAGFGGEDCSQITQNTAICPKGCAGHGTCQLGNCFCDPGWVGHDCAHPDPSPCENDCFSQGVCKNGQCFCYPGFSGPDCGNVLPCPPGCSKHGVCKYGRCFCQRGYGGANCSRPVAAEEAAAKAAEAEKKKPLAVAPKPCPNACSLHGFCFKGLCMCEPGYDGVACERVTLGAKECPNGCRGHVVSSQLPGSDAGASPTRGLCSLGKCFCYPGFAGPACEEEVVTPCPADCSSHGVCQYGKCFCRVGYEGEACEREIKNCEHNCHGNGVCTRGRCLCHSGFVGEFCSKPAATTPCPKKCSGRGVCVMGQCMCEAGYSGTGCEHRAEDQLSVKPADRDSDQEATLRGSEEPETQSTAVLTAAKKSKASAIATALGAVKEQLNNRTDVSGAAAVNLTASRKPGGVVKVESPQVEVREKDRVKGVEARKSTAAENGAAAVANVTQMGSDGKEGVPLNIGETVSSGASSGAAASNSTASDSNATAASNTTATATTRFAQRKRSSHMQQGVLLETDSSRVSLLQTGSSADSSCASGCSHRGVCHQGRCFCYPGFTGEDCETQTPCPNDCGSADGSGSCIHGRCVCAPGFSGADCFQTVPCPSGCSGNGICHLGKCSCFPAYSGAACDVLEGGSSTVAGDGTVSACPNGCSGNGLCRAGTCYCASGFTGVSCQKALSAVFTTSVTSAGAARSPAKAAAAGSHLSPLATGGIAMGMAVVGALVALFVQGRAASPAGDSGLSDPLVVGPSC